MVCSLPPPLTDEEINTLLDDSADGELLHHIASCPDCAARLEQAKAFERALKGRLYRWNCPTPDALADYQMNLLSQRDRDFISQHLTTCPLCQAEVRRLDDFLANESTSQSRRMPDKTNWKPRYSVGRPAENPMRATLRGKTSGPIMIETEVGLTLFLELQIDAVVTKLVGQLVADNLVEWQGALVKVFRSHQIQASTTVGELGDFHCILADRAPLTVEISAENGQIVVVENLIFDE